MQEEKIQSEHTDSDMKLSVEDKGSIDASMELLYSGGEVKHSSVADTAAEGALRMCPAVNSCVSKATRSIDERIASDACRLLLMMWLTCASDQVVRMYSLF